MRCELRMIFWFKDGTWTTGPASELSLWENQPDFDRWEYIP